MQEGDPVAFAAAAHRAIPQGDYAAADKLLLAWAREHGFGVQRRRISTSVKLDENLWRAVKHHYVTHRLQLC